MLRMYFSSCVVRYVPSWVPGANFKRIAQVFRLTLKEALEWPVAFVRMQMEAGVAEPSLVTNIFDSLGGDPTAEEEDTIKWNAAAFYGAGADTVNNIFLSFADTGWRLIIESLSLFH